MKRIIGVRYRVKQTKEQEARPTTIGLFDEKGRPVHYDLKSVDDERDFARGNFPVKWRKLENLQEDISSFKQHQCKWRKKTPEDDLEEIHKSQQRIVETDRGAQIEICKSVPTDFDGLKEGDKVAMALGSGNILAGLFYNQGNKVGASVYRTPPNYLDKNRIRLKEQDHFNLLALFERDESFFYEVRQPDKAIINIAATFDLRQEAQKARIAYGNRLNQALIGQIYLDEEDDLEGLIAEQIKLKMLEDTTYVALEKEEAEWNDKLKEAVKAIPLWKVAEKVPGFGPRIFAGLISAIGDIRRFIVEPDAKGADSPEEWKKCKNAAKNKTIAKVLKFCGVHCLPNGKFPRRRSGQVCNWSPKARQSLFQLADQFNRQTKKWLKAKAENDDEKMEKYQWAGKLLHWKVVFRERHPNPILVTEDGERYDLIEGQYEYKDGVYTITLSSGDVIEAEGKMRYTNGHIHKMAIWRTLTRFVRFFVKQWLSIEKESQRQAVAA